MTHPQNTTPANPAQGVTDFRPDLGASEPEPDLRTILRLYYRQAFGEAKAKEFANRYLAALTAAIGAGGQAVAVKALEWGKYRNGDAEAVTPFGEIYTAYISGHWRITKNGKAGKFILGGDDVEAAKAGAQSDYERLILSTLSHPPQPADERVVEALRECLTYIRSPLRMTRDEDEEARRAKVIDRAVSALAQEGRS